MGPIALFDKSFLQSLSLDEAVWFDHFFLPVVSPLFYVETLADLEKAVRAGRTPEQEVGIIARKFPDLGGAPCVHHGTLALADLSGWRVPMDGRIPRAGGRRVELDGQSGVVFEVSKESEAFSRWQSGRFLDVERGIAKHWRRALRAIDLSRIAAQLREVGVDGKACKSLDAARALAGNVVAGTTRAFQRMGLVMATLQVPPETQGPIIKDWTLAGLPPVALYAPYAARVVEVELFFQFALAANLISTERPSHRVDIAYLNYLPFCMVFVSSDKLHRNCAPLFLREDQEFVWGPDLKADLARINTHFSGLSEPEKEQGVMRFAHAPPKIDGSIVRRLRARFLGAGYDDQRPVPIPEGEAEKNLVDHVMKWQDAEVPDSAAEGAFGAVHDEPDSMVIQKRIPRRKGSWWLVPKDLPDNPAW